MENDNEEMEEIEHWGKEGSIDSRKVVVCAKELGCLKND